MQVPCVGVERKKLVGYGLGNAGIGVPAMRDIVASIEKGRAIFVN